MKRLFPALLVCAAFFAFSAKADEFKPDDRVIFDITSEDWVTTKTAHVTAAIEAAVSANTAGNMRADMMKAIGDLAKADWRLTSFTRNQDQAGLEHWSAIFEARLDESNLNGLSEAAKKLSKPGMQLSVIGVDFTPTLDEMETARTNLRARIYKQANDQLAALNTALPGRNYRIALVNFTGDEAGESPMPRIIKGRAAMGMMLAQPQEADMSSQPAAPVERSEKVTLNARIVLAATPDARMSAPTAVPDSKR